MRLHHTLPMSLVLCGCVFLPRPDPKERITDTSSVNTSTTQSTSTPTETDPMGSLEPWAPPPIYSDRERGCYVHDRIENSILYVDPDTWLMRTEVVMDQELAAFALGLAYHDGTWLVFTGSELAMVDGVTGLTDIRPSNLIGMGVFQDGLHAIEDIMFTRNLYVYADLGELWGDQPASGMALPDAFRVSRATPFEGRHIGAWHSTDRLDGVDTATQATGEIVLENHDGWIEGIASFEGGIAILDGSAQILMFDATTGGALDVWQPPAGLTGGLWCTEGPAPTIP